MLAETLEMTHVATGDLFRAEARAGTPLGLRAAEYMERGELVPDDVTTAMLLDRLERPDAAGGTILDGFPRTRSQAEALDTALAERGAAITAALSIEVPPERLVERLSGRFICEAAGHPYNIASARPRVEGVCDEDGSRLVQREDDRPETVRARLATQLGALDDVIAYYRDRGALGTVDGDRPIEDVSADLIALARTRLAGAT
jgi:adenylate kinase